MFQKQCSKNISKSHIGIFHFYNSLGIVCTYSFFPLNYFEDFNSLGFVFFNFIFVAEFLSYLMNNIIAVVLFCKDEIIFYMFTSLLNCRVPF